MTSTTIPVFPGDLGAYADQAPELTAGLPRLGHAARHRKPNRPGRWHQAGKWPRIQRRAVTAAVTVAAALLLGALGTLIAPAPAHASAVPACRPYSFAVSGDRTCLPLNRENTAFGWAGPAQYERDIAFVRYCSRIGAAERRWGHEYKCTRLDDSGVWELARADHGPLWYDTQTCRAFASWEARQTWPRFNAMVRDSRHADTYLKVDVGALNRAEVEHAPRSVRAELTAFVWTDCNVGADE